MRAAYVMAAAERLTEAQGGYDAALHREQLYRDLHVAAARNRRSAARELDQTAAESRDGWMVWRCGDHPEPECAALNGRVFTVGNAPGIPGAVHPNCQCWAESWTGLHPPA